MVRITIHPDHDRCAVFMIKRSALALVLILIKLVLLTDNQKIHFLLITIPGLGGDHDAGTGERHPEEDARGPGARTKPDLT